jgi:hypothetical protein
MKYCKNATICEQINLQFKTLKFALTPFIARCDILLETQ